MLGHNERMMRFRALFPLVILILAVPLLAGQAQTSAQSSIMDRPKKESPQIIIVPAGTKITVDVSEENPPRNVPLRRHSSKVVNIVNVGSTVVIPALSKVTIQDSAGMMELTEVTIDRRPLQHKDGRTTHLTGRNFRGHVHSPEGPRDQALKQFSQSASLSLRSMVLSIIAML